MKKLVKFAAAAAVALTLTLPTAAAHSATTDNAVGESTITAALPSKVVLNMTQYPQQNALNCGAATLQAMLSTRGINISQAQAGKDVGWTPGNYTYGAGVAAGLNKYTKQTGGTYTFVFVPGNAGNAEKQLFINRLVKNARDGYPTAIAVAETKSTKNFPGHYPGNTTIRHWVASYGFNNNGKSVYIADSTAGSKALNWKDAKAKFEFNTDALWELVKDAGYVY